MAALKPSARCAAPWIAALVLLVAPAPAQETPEPPVAADEPVAGEAAVEEPGAGDPAAAAAEHVAAAEEAFLTADFERALELSRQALEAAEATAPEWPPAETALRDLSARALDIVAQSQFNLGETGDLDGTLRRLVAVDPGYRIDPATAGQRLAEQFEALRAELTGTLEVTCQPLSCERVLVDGRPVTPNEDGAVRVLAGGHEVVLQRRGFEPVVLDEVDVPAGETIPIERELVQVARDVVLRSEPPGVQVLVNGEPVGRTEPAADPEGPSQAFVIPELAAGQHVVVLDAPCRHRVEQRVEVVIDRFDPSPLDMGVVRLGPARAFVELFWDGMAGTLTLDGEPVESGRHEVCPGEHTASLAVGGRRVWFESVELHDGETFTARPRPRPTLAIGETDRAALEALEADDWNLLLLDEPTVRQLTTTLAPLLEAAEVPYFPRVLRTRLGERQDAVAAAAPTAGVIALVLRGTDALRQTRVLTLVEPEQGLVEMSAWRAAEAAGEMAAALDPEFEQWTGFFGFDVVDRLERPPAVAMVQPDGPAARAGVAPGMAVLAANGEVIAGAADLEALRTALESGAQLQLRLEAPDGEREVTIDVARNVTAPHPGELEAGFLVPHLALAEVQRVSGSPADRVAGAFHAGLLLAALGAERAAATALDRASLDEEFDPSGDARGTALWMLERILRRLGDTYADEVQTRLGTLRDARLGGRTGPPLRHAVER
jgi:hypothetical protein